jgi:RNA polymerase sigma-70 factor, ECF subfamily
MRRTHLNMHRRQRSGTVADWDTLRHARPAFGATKQASAEDEVLDQSLHHWLSQALDDLDPRYRETLWLVDVNDLSYADAAAVLGVPVGTVMSRLSRARDRVRRQLGPAVLTARRLP